MVGIVMSVVSVDHKEHRKDDKSSSLFFMSVWDDEGDRNGLQQNLLSIVSPS